MSANVGSAYFSLRASTDQLGNDIAKGMKMAKQRLKAAAVSIGRVTSIALTAGAAALTAGVSMGRKAIDDLAKESDKLGITTERLQMLRFAAELTGVSANNLGTGLQRMTRRVAEAAQGTGEAVKALQELGLDAQALAQLSPDQIFLRIGDAMREVTNQSDKIRLAMKLFDSEGVGLVNTLKLTGDQLGQLEQEFENLGIAIDRKAAASVEQMNDALTKAGIAATAFSNEITVKLSPAITVLANGIAGTIVELKPFLLTVGAGGFAVVRFFANELGKMTLRFNELQQALISGQVALDEFFQKLTGRGPGTDIERLRMRLIGLKVEAGAFKHLFGDAPFDKAMKDAAESITSAFEVAQNEISITRERIVEAAEVATEHWNAFAFNAMSAIDEFVETGKLSIRGFVTDVLQDLAKIQLRQLFFGEKGILGGIFGGLAKSLGITTSEVPGKALGGRAFPAQIVGERGAELFVPDSSGTIVPNTETQGLLSRMGSGGVNVTMNFASGVSRQELAAEAQNIEERVVRGILNAKRSGGQFAAEFS